MDGGSGIKIKDTPDADVLKISQRELTVPVGGARPEPEEMPAQRILQVDQALDGHLNKATGGPALGSIATRIVYEDTVETFAQGYRSQCIGCKHFDRKAWHELKRVWDTSDSLNPKIMEGKLLLQNMRLQLDDHARGELREPYMTPEGDMDVEQALLSFGVCHVFTEIFRDPIIVAPVASCPRHGPNLVSCATCSGTGVLAADTAQTACTDCNSTGKVKEFAPNLFEPRDTEIDKRFNQTYDGIMNQAAGKR